MDPRIYSEIISQENDHWWFCARRAIVGHVLSTLNLPHNPRILDAGCGSGGNLPLLSRYTDQLYGFELNDAVRKHAYMRGIGKIEAGQLPDAIPFAGTDFDLITLFDVLEHVKDDSAALTALHARLKPGGLLFMTVPAFPELFGPLDELHHHFRRYRRDDIRARVIEAGFEIHFMNYWNILLFPVAILVRLSERFGKPRTDAFGVKAPPYLINKILSAIVSCERFIIPRITLPFGLSIIVIARKPL